MRLGKSGGGVAPAGPRLLPRGGSPSPAPSLPSSAPSRQERSLPIPSSAPCPARGEVARGRGPGPAPEPPLSVLCSSASIPGRVPPPALETLRVRVPQPRSIAARGTRLLSPNPLGCPGSSPQPCALSPHGTSRGIPGSAVAVGGCRWPGSLPCRPPRCRDRAARFLGGSPGMCRPPGAPHVLGWRPGSGLGRGRVGISLGHL